MKNAFRRIANSVSAWAGSASAFLGAILVVLVWATTGPLFHYSDTWQLVINTGTTIVTFLMVFLIQNTQNRDGKAVQVKLDELIRATKGARLHYMNLEDLTDEEIDELDSGFKELVKKPGIARQLDRLNEHIRQEHARRHGLHLPNPFHHSQPTDTVVVDDVIHKNTTGSA